MRVQGLSIGIHFPLKREKTSKSLAPLLRWPVHDVADYEDQCPDDWVALGAPSRGVFFIGVPKPGEEEHDRELWFDFRTMQNDPHHLVVLITVQGLNAISGLPIAEGMRSGLYEAPGRAALEKYLSKCPAHGVDLQARRMCPQCGFRWPAQNYITNAAGHDSVNKFWRDGWRTAEGIITQFMIRPTEAGEGVAQQILGEHRNLAIDIAVFRSKEKRPAPPAPSPRPLRRLKKYGLTGGVRKKNSLSGRRIGACTSSTSRIGAPSQMEIGRGCEVSQEVHPDPNELDYWQSEPCAIFTLVPTDLAWVKQVTKDGPTTKTLEGGAFAGAKPVS